MKNRIILHIPHSSLKLTKEFKALKKEISDNEIKNFNNTITDLFTAKLFNCHKFKNIKAKYSRICVDMEKFANDTQEEMSKYGMGVIYTKTNLEENIINVNKEYKELILKKYYFPYHKKIDKIVNKYLNKNKNVILIDCHSFSNEIIMNGKTENLPDICIGYNENLSSSSKLLKVTYDFFNKRGYKTKINYPYKGSMIPNSLIKKNNKNFDTIMIEVNKNLYLDNLKKTQYFSKLKKDLLTYLNCIQTSKFE